MAYNVYMFTLNSKGEFTKKVWKDVVKQRSTGKITTKKSRDYNLLHGDYIHESDLNKIRGKFFLTKSYRVSDDERYNQPIFIEGYLKYCTYEDDLPNSVKNLMYTQYYGMIAEVQRVYLNNIAQLVKDVNFENLHPVDFKAFYENPFETFKDGILNRIKETMKED